MSTQKYIFHYYRLTTEEFQLCQYGCGRTDDGSTTVIDVPRLLIWKHDALHSRFESLQKAYLDDAVKLIKDGVPCACGKNGCAMELVKKLIAKDEAGTKEL